MPKVFERDGFVFFFYSNDGSEPPHIHVEHSGAVAKFWLEPVALASSSRLRGRDLRRLERLVAEHRDEFLEAWRDFFEP